MDASFLRTFIPLTDLLPSPSKESLFPSISDVKPLAFAEEEGKASLSATAGGTGSRTEKQKKDIFPELVNDTETDYWEKRLRELS